VGVALLKKVRNPIVLAREMLVRGETDGGGGHNGGDGDPSGGQGGAQGHVFLSGETAEKLAKEWGCAMVEEGWHYTKKRWDEHRRGLRKDADKVGKVEGRDSMDGDVDWDGKEYLPQGTVGCVCLDRDGTLCVATSTGGLTNKLPGRIGDTPTLGAGFWAEEWEFKVPNMTRQPRSVSPLTLLLSSISNALSSFFSALPGYDRLPTSPEANEKASQSITCAAAMSGTGNGDSFLRLNAVRTAAAIFRFSPNSPLGFAVNQIAGPGGELQKSAGDRWGKTGEGEGGIIGIELVGRTGQVVFDFNCGGMYRAWVDGVGRERVMVFREEY